MHRGADAAPELLDMTLDEVEQVVAAAGERPYRAGQVLHWTYARGAKSFDEMHDLPGRLRQYLKEHVAFGGATGPAAIAARSVIAKSSDGTRK
ncbi:MAG TPA: hypothetical protein VEU51_16615, partial [Candidatus Acidoferrales bacterium]|nr:hypothetical protein [Candidatus Acidoferrales bacterium]